MVLSAAPVAPLAAHPMLVFLLQVGLLLASAVVLGRLAARLAMPTVAGELLAGVLLGPSLLDHVAPALSGWLLPKDPAQFHLLDAFGQIGVLLLVGVTGAQLDFALMRRQGAVAVRVSLSGLAVPLALGVGAGFLLPGALMADGADRRVFAFFLGVAMCVSAIPVIARTLADMGLLHRDIGQLTLTAGMVDDAAGWLLLSVVSAMAATGVTAVGVAASAGALLLVVVLAFAARPVAGPLLGWSARPGTQDRSVPTMIALMLLAAAGTHALGLEPIFGAFLGGIVIGSTGAVSAERLAPLRSLVTSFLAPVFFAAAGLRMDLTALGRPLVLWTGLAVLLLAVAGKFAGAFAGALLGGLNRWEALALGAGLNARGVVEVVVATVGLRLGVLSTASYTIVVLVAIITSLMAPPVLRLAMARVETTAEEELRGHALALVEPH
ncbi:cation:proton antiporter [Actinomadura macrotermitis]|uniref:Na(+)/H(+)-K(+) antiporter GerN n=1 Tax=Actinomadura macrotermitis TaxID=2585200 RepID=A0A7K0BU24_9ACTN|nr:Na(+)/H(+)-K(+) antiporter GerN [Actinomadura macrotermitis]